jgi:hypothetical protein
MEAGYGQDSGAEALDSHSAPTSNKFHGFHLTSQVGPQLPVQEGQTWMTEAPARAAVRNPKGKLRGCPATGRPQLNAGHCSITTIRELHTSERRQCLEKTDFNKSIHPD